MDIILLSLHFRGNSDELFPSLLHACQGTNVSQILHFYIAPEVTIDYH